MPGAPMLEARIDRKVFRAADGQTHEVLRDIALSIGPGEVIGLLGASGTGKSTTLRILLGLDTAFEGEVRRGRLRIGVMFQEPRLLPWLTVAENLRLVVTADMPPPDIPGLLEMVELPQAARLYPRQLSLGMARRAALARALAVSPDLLVLDEPFASLDRRLGAGLGEMVARWAQRGGGSVLLATHDLVQAVGLCSRLLILAGAPAGLAADISLSAGGDPQAVLTGLVARFAFLSQAGEERLPSAPQPA